jgi:pilus assembly protein Flp/PilA
MKTLFARFVKDQSGATAIEYGLMAAILGVGLVAGLTALRGKLVESFQTVGTELTKAH